MKHKVTSKRQVRPVLKPILRQLLKLFPVNKTYINQLYIITIVHQVIPHSTTSLSNYNQLFKDLYYITEKLLAILL